MAAVVSYFPNDVEALKALLGAALQRADEAEARAAHAIEVVPPSWTVWRLS